MVDPKIKEQEEILFARLKHFLNGKNKWGNELGHALRQFEATGGSAYLIGGLLRDLMLVGTTVVPRDIDVVFGGVKNESIELLFWNHLKRRNRFGGYHLVIRGCHFDVWALKDTWAFRERIIPKIDFSTLPETTFLNIDAIALKIGKDAGREVFTKGFFEGILNKTIEINLEENPFPETCVMRSLLLASKLEFAIGSKLANYISRHSRFVPLEKFEHIQKLHYGAVEYDIADIRAFLKCINGQLRCSKNSKVFLPKRQFKLWTHKSAEDRNVRLAKWIHLFDKVFYSGSFGASIFARNILKAYTAKDILFKLGAKKEELKSKRKPALWIEPANNLNMASSWLKKQPSV